MNRSSGGPAILLAVLLLTVWLPRMVVAGQPTSAPTATSGSVPSPSPQPTPLATPTPVDSAGESAGGGRVTEGIVKIVGAIQQLVTTLGWQFSLLVIIIFFRRPLLKLLETITAAMADREVKLDIASTVKVEVGERSLDAADERTAWNSRLPLEMEDPQRDRSSILVDIAPQLDLPVSDYRARHWSRAFYGIGAAALGQAAEALEQTCANNPHLAEVRPQLVAYCEWLEATRFLNAKRLAALLEQYGPLGADVDNIQPPQLAAANREDFLILHCAGVAYAQRGLWDRAKGVLDKIARRDADPYYLPAGDVWLSAVYGNHIATERTNNPDLDIGSPVFSQAIGMLLTQGQQIVAAMQTADWRTFFASQANNGFYKREIRLVMGSIASMVGEILPAQREDYFDQAEPYLQQCILTIDGDPPSPLDHNNLADFYRQRVRLPEAHAELDRAFREPDPDSTFYDTRARIFWKQNRPLDGLLALERYTSDQARDPQDVEQYVENQLLAARLAAAIDPDMSPPYVAKAISILEGALRFIELKADLLADSAPALRAEIEDMLGFAYMLIPGQESNAVEAFNRLRQIADNVSPQTRWRRRLGRARALTRLAGIRRRNFSADVAAQSWEAADRELADTAAAVAPFDVDANVPASRRSRHFRLRLDTVGVLEAFAEESFCEGKWQRARELVNDAVTILGALRTAFDRDPAPQQWLGGAQASREIRTQIGLYDARSSFLLGRIRIRTDPSFHDSDTIVLAEASLNAARGIDADLECRIDLELGQVLLDAATAGVGDAVALYRRAVAALERAATRNAPALRTDTIMLLADAYARRGAVLGKARQSKQSA